MASGENEIHIFSRKPEDGHQPGPAAEQPDIHIHEIDSPSGAINKFASSLFTIFASFFHSRPARIAERKGAGQEKNWLVGVVAKADEVAAGKKQQGYEIIAIGTYSPIEALIAAKAISRKYKTPCILDFRDGFVFESRGREGIVYAALRKLIEKSIISSTDLITSVSMPLVNYFKKRYPANRVEYLPNGFDRSEFTAGSSGQEARLAENIDQIFKSGHTVIGHFGRVSGSDTSRLESLRFLIDSINDFQGSLNALHLVFIGKLQEQDLSLLKKLKCHITVIPHLPREEILGIMGKCNFLLLITGDLTSCATGKLFEYMASGPEIICVSGVENEASHIIESTNCGQTLLVGDKQGAADMLQAITAKAGITNGPRGSTEIFEKPYQARLLMKWINEMSHEEARLSAVENQ